MSHQNIFRYQMCIAIKIMNIDRIESFENSKATTTTDIFIDIFLFLLMVFFYEKYPIILPKIT